MTMDTRLADRVYFLQKEALEGLEVIVEETERTEKIEPSTTSIRAMASSLFGKLKEDC